MTERKEKEYFIIQNIKDLPEENLLDIYRTVTIFKRGVMAGMSSNKDDTNDPKAS